MFLFSSEVYRIKKENHAVGEIQSFPLGRVVISNPPGITALGTTGGHDKRMEWRGGSCGGGREGGRRAGIQRGNIFYFFFFDLIIADRSLRIAAADRGVRLR